MIGRKIHACVGKLKVELYSGKGGAVEVAGSAPFTAGGGVGLGIGDPRF